MDADQQPTRVLAIRHGETAWNVDGRIQGQLDVPLNETGRWQVHRLALAMAEEDIAAVYSSDLLRALETAQAVARGSGDPVVTDTGLRERGFGTFEGMSYAEINERWPDMGERWRRRDPTFGAPGGETLNEFYARSIATASRIAALHPGQTIALVSHGGVMDCLYRAATRVALDAPRSWQLGNAAINRLLYTPQGFTLVGWSDTYHLDDDSRDEAAA
ncbi:histidine phosphatase family protein [Rhizobacter sp. Root404]|uniref:histidine phosphatase family protein n=1 Tax=Rhizobacter sp. Root404 TaxID=1736528 RepID=UPI0006F1D12C|nr:histidine phosphatase family protein [Rhizobacter sp. Root404]KQW38756.1 phosphoglycerate mutase [Rhizobacter sp. Root404]